MAFHRPRLGTAGDRPGAENDGVAVDFENLPGATLEVRQESNQGADAGEDEIKRVRDSVGGAVTDQHVADHAAGGGGEQGQENEANDVEVALARDGAADNAVEDNTNEVQAAVEQVDRWVH